MSSRKKELVLKLNDKKAKVLSIFSVIVIVLGLIFASWSFVQIVVIFNELDVEIVIYAGWSFVFVVSVIVTIVFIYIFVASRRSTGA